MKPKPRSAFHIFNVPVAILFSLRLQFQSIARWPSLVSTGSSLRISTRPILVKVLRSSGLTGDSEQPSPEPFRQADPNRAPFPVLPRHPLLIAGRTDRDSFPQAEMSNQQIGSIVVRGRENPDQ
jgi:hypothetical protein